MFKTFRIQSHDSSICEFYCVDIIEYMIAGKKLLDYIKLFSLCDYGKNKTIKQKCFIDNIGKENGSLEFRLKIIDETRK